MSPPRGHVRLYSAIRPALFAGQYTLSMGQTVKTEGGADIGSLPDTHQQLDLVAPRYRMAGSELYSLFPPPNAQGPFSNRFAQAVLKRRTLPWERPADPDRPTDRRTPWLALIVLAESEGTLRTDVPLSAAELADYRDGIDMTPAAAARAGTCDVLEVTGRAVRKAFPSRSDLPYLVHVREVNLLDSEDANRVDDDGFVAVVASNRVLRGGQHYGAYLVSIEGQLDVLPNPAAPGGDHSGHTTDRIGPVRVTWPPMVHVADPIWESPGMLAVDAATRRGITTTLGEAVIGSTGAAASGAARSRFDGWSAVDEAVAEGAAEAAGRRFRSPDRGPGMTEVEATDAAAAAGFDYVAGDRDRHRFPVLAHWTFDTLLHGDFETLMRNLDVGLLGTVGDDLEDPPTVLATGHNLLDRHTRSGERSAGWYRGPLVPQELADRDDVPLHAAEQAIRVGSDGIEDLSYAAAFELGRLLALADPRFVGALVDWRRSGSTMTWSGLQLETLDMALFPRADFERFERHLGLGAVQDLLGGDRPIDVLGRSGGPLGPLVNPVPLREQYRPAEDLRRLQEAGLPRTVAEAAVGLATDASLGAGVTDVGLAPDAGIAGGLDAVAGLAEGAYAGRLRAALDAAFARDVARSGAESGGGG